MGIDRRGVLAAGGASLAVLSLGGNRALAQAANLQAPQFELLPNAIGLGDTIFDPTAQGYDVREFLMTGQAPTRTPVSAGEAGQGAAPGSFGYPENFGAKAVTGSAPYTTRVVVYTPKNASRFSGNVVIEPYHSRNYPEVFSVVDRFLLKRGDAVIHVAQPVHLPMLRAKYPDRYARLGTPNGTTLWGYLAQLATLVKMNGAASPIRGRVRRVYLTGYSQTSQTTFDFYNYHHNETRLPNGAPVIDGYVPLGRLVLLAPARDAALMNIGTESDYLARYGGSTPAERAFRPNFDSDAAQSRRRRWELPGLFHAPHQPPAPDMPLAPFDPPLIWNQCSAKEFPAGIQPAFDGPERPFFEAAFHHVSRWVDQGVAPPRAPQIEADGEQTIYDEFGSAKGGLRMPELDVPTSKYVRAPTNQACGATGWKVDFPKARLVEMYGSRQRYLARYDAAADALVKAGYILADGAADMKRNRRITAPIF